VTQAGPTSLALEDQRIIAFDNQSSAGQFEIERWINVEAIRLLVHHASAVVAAIVIFAGVARIAIWLLPHGPVRRIVVIIDDIVLIALVAWFGYEMLEYLWQRHPQNGTHAGPAVAWAVAELRLPRLPIVLSTTMLIRTRLASL
jgi:hypothetical protein